MKFLKKIGSLEKFVTGALFFAAVGAGAGDVVAAKSKSAMCAACHGANGISAAPTYPNLAAQEEAYRVAPLMAFRDGGRNHPVMAPMARPLSNPDIDNGSAYDANLKP